MVRHRDHDRDGGEREDPGRENPGRGSRHGHCPFRPIPPSRPPGTGATGLFVPGGRCVGFRSQRGRQNAVSAATNKPESKARGRNPSPLATAQRASPAGIEAKTTQQYRSLSVRLARKARLGSLRFLYKIALVCLPPPSQESNLCTMNSAATGLRRNARPAQAWMTWSSYRWFWSR